MSLGWALLLACDPDTTTALDTGCRCPDDTGTTTATDTEPPDSGSGTDTGATAPLPEPDVIGTDAAVGVVQAEGGLGSQGCFAGVGDLDGDGFGELWIGVPSASSLDAEGAGAAWLVRGPVTGTVGFDLVETVVYGASQADQLGLRVGPAGDMDGDGAADVWVSAPQARSGEGEIVLFGAGDLGPGVLSPDHAAAVIVGDTQTGAMRSVGQGDLDGDGVDDLLVGSVRVQGGQATPWWAFYGPISGRVGLGSGDAVRTLLVESGDWDSTYEAGALSELTGDGYADVALADHASTLSAGRVSIYEGSDAGVSRTIAQVIGATALDNLGASGALDVPGDLDGDGFGDLIVGASDADDGAVDGGAAWVLYGPLSGVYSLAAHGERLHGTETAAGVGTWVAGAGDANGDGLGDVFVGDAGDSYLFLGPVTAGPLGSAAWTFSGSTPYAAGVGDLDGDGREDLGVLGASGAGLRVYGGL